MDVLTCPELPQEARGTTVRAIAVTIMNMMRTGVRIMVPTTMARVQRMRSAVPVAVEAQVRQFLPYSCSKWRTP